MDRVNAGAVACHRILDPMRNVYRSNLTYRYFTQSNATQLARVSSFDFGGVNNDLHTLDDFAATLVAHPMFASAWVQKVCTWANSTPCATDDPAFVALVSDFRTGNYDFKAMLVATLNSTLVTNASRTAASTQGDEFMSVARMGHLCTSLQARLGLAQSPCVGAPTTLDAATKREVTSELALVTPNLPKDGFARGSETPIMPGSATMFYRGAVESLCEAGADMAVDQTGGLFSSTEPDAALDLMVTRVMGLSVQDPGFDGVRAISPNIIRKRRPWA